MNWQELLCKITFHVFKFKKCYKCHPMSALDYIKTLLPLVAATAAAGFIMNAMQDKRLLNKGRPKKKRKKKKK